MKQYKINYFKDMKGGVLVTNKTDDTLPKNYVLLESIMNISLSRDVAVTESIEFDIKHHYICGGNSCIYGPVFNGNILRLSIDSEEISLTELAGYNLLLYISTLPESDGKQFIMKINDFGRYQMIFDENIQSPFKCIATPINIIGVNCKNMSRSGIYGIIEHCEGEDLFSALSDVNNFTDITQIKIVIKNILRAVAFLHRNNIIHCDLKLENIALKQKGNMEDIRLIDFGGAKQSDDGIKKKLPINLDTTPREVRIFGHSKKSDIYSIGCIVLKILIRGGLIPLRVQPIYDNERPTKRLRPSPITTERELATSPIQTENTPAFTSPITTQSAAEEELVLPAAEEELVLPIFVDKPRLENLYDINHVFIPEKFKSNDLKRFCNNLLDIDFDTRFTAEEALSHSWLADV